ncbi:hypothetical protein SNE40_004730 [Patella caerulea]|uniref:EF-hand domain-containing protein n=1 Tax=Patella caerulea TaxID=87958 RepID=A0AAN8K3I9_PATCE
MGQESSKNGPRTIEELWSTGAVSLSDVETWIGDFMTKSGNRDYFTESDLIKHYQKSYTSGDASAFARDVFRVMDRDRNGKVDFKEFTLTMTSLTGDDVNKKIDWAFWFYDVNGDGTITYDELKKMLKTICSLEHGGNFKDKEGVDNLVKNIMSSMDTNHDGLITLSEFKDGFHKSEFCIGVLKKLATI